MYNLYCRLYQTIFKIVTPILPWRRPEILKENHELVRILKENRIERILLVTDAGLTKLKLPDKLIETLKNAGISCIIYDKTSMNPTISNIEEALKLYKKNNCEAIIAFGGGSPIDCAKAIGARIARPNKSVQKMRGVLKVVRKLPLLIAVPTTSGTGSETTVAAVIVDDQTHEKYSITDTSLIPKYALLDPKLTIGLPNHITAQTGIDALVHAIEAYIGSGNTMQTKLDALEATSLIFKYLKRAYDNGNDLEARDNMQKAAFLAGAAFTRAYVGNIHAIAHTLGGEYGTTHGLANAVIMPYVLEDYGQKIYPQLSELAKAAKLGKKSYSDEANAKILLSAINELNEYMNIPSKINDLKEEDIIMLAKRALREANPLYPVPVIYDLKHIESIYRKILYIKPEKQKIDLSKTLNEQNNYFNTGVTKNIKFRKNQLKTLSKWIKNHDEQILAALNTDLGKARFEGYATEVGVVLDEIRHTQKHLKKWARDKRVLSPLKQFPSKSFVRQEPYGIALIMSPWNYPFQLTVAPLIGAIAAGNCAVIKPSAYSPATSAVIANMINECFPNEYITIVEGGRDENRELLKQRFDYIFFTGGMSVGKLVMEAASKNLTPLTLELGGKSPCIIDESTNVSLAAKRIVWGKFVNAGQTCVAPDYILVHQRVKDEFIKEVKKYIINSYGENSLEYNDLSKIINEKHFNRLNNLIKNERILYGGKSNSKSLKIEPTIIDNPTWDSPIMSEEIFGPIMPIISYNDLDDIIKKIKSRPKPLALYLFTSNKKIEKKILEEISFGGGCINDTIVHVASTHLGFGGVGESGIGSYHGKENFNTFSHKKSILKKSKLIDLPLRYAPYKELYLKLLKKI